MPSQDDVLNSLSRAADAARQAYMTAQGANPGADLSKLYAQEMAALDAWSEAEDKALDGAAPGLAAAQTSLDAITTYVRGDLAKMKNVATCLQALDNLVKAATSLAAFFP